MLFTISCSTFISTRTISATLDGQQPHRTTGAHYNHNMPSILQNQLSLARHMHALCSTFPLVVYFYMSSVCLCIKNNYLDACICANYNYLSTFVPALSVQIFCDFICQHFLLLIIRPYFARIAEIDKMSFPLFSA